MPLRLHVQYPKPVCSLRCATLFSENSVSLWTNLSLRRDKQETGQHCPKGPKYLYGTKYGFCSPYGLGKYTPYGYLGPFGLVKPSKPKLLNLSLNPRSFDFDAFQIHGMHQGDSVSRTVVGCSRTVEDLSVRTLHLCHPCA